MMMMRDGYDGGRDYDDDGNEGDHVAINFLKTEEIPFLNFFHSSVA